MNNGENSKPQAVLVKHIVCNFAETGLGSSYPCFTRKQTLIEASFCPAWVMVLPVKFDPFLVPELEVDSFLLHMPCVSSCLKLV